MSEPLVSVCMAAYNHAPFIRAAVESVLQQTVSDWELLITDDGSSDGTLAAISDLVDPRIKLSRFSENRTACVALNSCIRQAQGQFIAILNSDDLWVPEKLERQVDIMREQPNTAAVFTLATMIDERGNLLPQSHRHYGVFQQSNRDRLSWLRRFLLQGNCLCHPSALVRSSTYKTVGLYDPCFAQLPDLDMWLRVCLHHDIWVIQEPLTLFRVLDHERNASGERPDVQVRTAIESFLVCVKVFREYPAEIARVLKGGSLSMALPADEVGIQHLFNEILSAGDNGPLPEGLRYAMILWMYETIQKGGSWRECKQFIARTGAVENNGAHRGRPKKVRSWWRQLRDSMY
jgi:glycosyltransferase involved in cell wall biosynthesis